jgi:hypothetical protein
MQLLVDHRISSGERIVAANKDAGTTTFGCQRSLDSSPTGNLAQLQPGFKRWHWRLPIADFQSVPFATGQSAIGSYGLDGLNLSDA